VAEQSCAYSEFDSPSLQIADPAEVWRPVVGYQGYYEVSDLGRVRRVHGCKDGLQKRVLSARLNRHGRLQVTLTVNAVPRTWQVHTLVATAFVGPRPPGREVNHKDGVKVNNAASNLEWVTRSENIAHGKRLGLFASGERHAHAKLKEDDVRQIRLLGSEPHFDLRKIAEKFRITSSMVGKILRREYWRNISPNPGVELSRTGT